jgi:hypothetical protein
LRAEAIRRSVQMKADIVARDETEQGDRALLNLGHTFGHALEAATGYSDRLLHGEGVAIGCALAFELSARLGLCAQEEPSRVRAHLADMKMKRDLADIPGELPDADGLLSLMAQDKKVVDGQLRFILARGIGEAFVTADVPGDTVRACWKRRWQREPRIFYENSHNAKIRRRFGSIRAAIGFDVLQRHIPGKEDPGVLADPGDEGVDHRLALGLGVDGGEMRLGVKRAHNLQRLAAESTRSSITRTPSPSPIISASGLFSTTVPPGSDGHSFSR